MVFIVTTNDVPGYRIDAVLGEVMGVTVRSRNWGQNFSSSLRSLSGGELPEYTQNAYESRQEVTTRMVAETQAKGGNAIVGARFESSSIGEVWTELCAYGTAVVVTPIPEGAPGATQQSAAHARGQ
ncbi:MAG: YbjQ family protein [Cellulomonadaceae bacterium]